MDCRERGGKIGGGDPFACMHAPVVVVIVSRIRTYRRKRTRRCVYAGTRRTSWSTAVTPSPSSAAYRPPLPRGSLRDGISRGD